MHSVFFGWKRTHWATVNFFRDALTRLGVTSNRFEILLYLHRHNDAYPPLTQRDLRAAFGVARATMSEALRSLERLGFVARASAADTRTYDVTLTDRGLAVFDHARRMIKGLVDRTLTKIFEPGYRLLKMHDDIDGHLRVRRALGDTATRELIHLWHPDD